MMADTLATINVEQLSNAVNAVVHAADSTQKTGAPRQVQSIITTANQVTPSNVVHLPINNLQTIAGNNNTVTIGNSALPVMLVRMAPPTANQLSNQMHTLPLQTVNQVGNQMQVVPVGRTIGQTNGNVVGQIGNIGMNLQPKSVNIAQPGGQIQTITIPNNFNPSAIYANQNTMTTDQLGVNSGPQNITFGNILSVQQKPSSDILVLNPTGVQLANNAVGGSMATTTFVQQPTSSLNTNSTIQNNQPGQSPAINLNLNINMPTSSSHQTQQSLPVAGPTLQTIQHTTPEKSMLRANTAHTLQLTPPVMQQFIQIPAAAAAGNLATSSSVVNIPIAGVMSPNNIVHHQQSQTSTSNIAFQLAPVLQAVPRNTVITSHKSISMPSHHLTTPTTPHAVTTQATNSSSPQVTQINPVTQVVPSQCAVSSQQPVQQSRLSQILTGTAPSTTVTSQVLPLPSNIQGVSNMATHFPHTTNSPAKLSATSQMDHAVGGSSSQTETVQIETTVSLQTETSNSSQNLPGETITPEGSQKPFSSQEVGSLETDWPQLQITQSSTTSTNPQGTTSGQDMHHMPSPVTSIPIHMTAEESAPGSIQLTSGTPLSSILSELAQAASASVAGNDTHQGTEHGQISTDQYHHHDDQQQPVPGHEQTTHHQLTLETTSSASHPHHPGVLAADPVSAASMVAGVSAEDIDGLDMVSIPLSLSGLSVTPADFIQEEIDTGIWCVDCKKYNPTNCTEHEPIMYIRDSLIESHAKQTLPKILTISPSKIVSKCMGVFANETIEERTQFGPLQGRLVSKDDKSMDMETHWKIFSQGNLSHCIDVSDERVCNWMMFVKIARSQKDQNLVAYQQGNSIYFTTIKKIEIGEELLYWYCNDYTLWIGVPSKPDGTFSCHLCPMQFTKLAQLKGHNKYVHANMNPRRWKCSMCARAFSSQAKLNVHILVHMGVRPHKCEHCDKTFTDPSNLRQHRLIHTGQKRFACPTCNKAFRQKSHLEAHMVIHTGEKKLKCKYCDLMFARPNDVTQHMYKHTKEKEVSCETCGRVFWRIGHLKKHQKQHTGERDFHCTICTKTFVTSYHLKRHMQTCKGPAGSKKKAATKKRPAKDLAEGGKSGRTENQTSPARTHRTSSSRGRPIVPKIPFTIVTMEARPSRLRNKKEASEIQIQRSPTAIQKSRKKRSRVIKCVKRNISDLFQSANVATTSAAIQMTVNRLVDEGSVDESGGPVEETGGSVEETGGSVELHASELKGGENTPTDIVEN